MNFTEITFSKIKSQIENFMTSQYSKADLIYSSSSPYGQILFVIENLFQLSMLYLKNSIKQFDITDPTSINERIIKNVAISAGHIPTRNISSTGTLKFSIKSSTNIESDIPGGRITFNNRQSIKNKTNGLGYSLNIGSEKQTYKVSSSTQIFIPIIQGTWQSQTFTGDGTLNQTYQVTTRSNQQGIENFNYEVLLNGVSITIYKHIYDMSPDENACVVRTGFNGGIDIIFGNGGFGAAPKIGDIITINYLLSDGASGSIFRRTANDWIFVDPVIDGFGNSLDITKVFDISIYTDINFGADKESVDFTKSLLPISSNNFVLGLPQQYAYTIKRLGVFSYVNAYQLNGVIYIVATPNIQLFQSQNGNYFTININAFTLDDYEISKIDLYLKTGGNLMLTQKYVITSPTLSYYIINVFVVIWSDAILDNVTTQIIDTLSQYFLNLSKINRIPKSDIVSQLALISEINSVDISVVCKNNEDYHRMSKITADNLVNQYSSQTAIADIKPSYTYDPNKVIGIDPVLGDIIFESSEIPIIRGGWYDRNNIYYTDDIESSTFKSVNVIQTGVIDSKYRNHV